MVTLAFLQSKVASLTFFQCQLRLDIAFLFCIFKWPAKPLLRSAKNVTVLSLSLKHCRVVIQKLLLIRCRNKVQKSGVLYVMTDLKSVQR